jgi:hypothetical protein
MDIINHFPIEINLEALRLLFAESNLVPNADPMNLSTPYITPIGQAPVGVGGSADIWKATLIAQDGFSILVCHTLNFISIIFIEGCTRLHSKYTINPTLRRKML